VLADQYTIQEVLGRGSNGVTYKATRSADGKTVAIKALSLRSMQNWKQLELFEREAQTLESLAHPGIPQYLDYFEQDTAQDRGFYLVQELAEGKSLADLIQSGWHADEAEVTRIAKEILGILQYLSSRRPSVIHRDLKPENIVLEGGKTGGRLFLVDFGGVQAAAFGEGAGSLGSTIIGTYGYMAPEQFRGSAQPASDLYGLGGVLLYLLSGKAPHQFPQNRLRVEFEDLIEVGPQLSKLLEGLLEPIIEDRLTASEALALLDDARQESSTWENRAVTSTTSGRSSTLQRQPAGGRCQVRSRGDRLRVVIPPAKLDSGSAYPGFFAIAWNAFVATWTIGAIAGGGWLLAAFSLPFWGAGFSLARTALGGSLIKEKFDIDGSRWKLTQQLPFISDGSPDWLKGRGRTLSGKTKDLLGARIVTAAYINSQPQTQIELHEGVRVHVMGEALKAREQEWLVEVINEHLAKQGIDTSKLPQEQPPRMLPPEPGFYTSFDERDEFGRRRFSVFDDDD
jgi:hypothetical protein